MGVEDFGIQVFDRIFRGTFPTLLLNRLTRSVTSAPKAVRLSKLVSQVAASVIVMRRFLLTIIEF